MTSPFHSSASEFPAPANAVPAGDPITSKQSGPAASPLANETAQILFTPKQAAQLLQVRESWLRRRAAQRTVQCTFLGKHLRFSRDDLEKIAEEAAQNTKRTNSNIEPPRTTRRRRSAHSEHS